MSDKDDCTSQEIEASPSSDSTRDSNKRNFVRSILRVDDSQMVCGQSSRRLLAGEESAHLPQLEKAKFIQNWIIAHSKPFDSSEKSQPSSPILGTSKRSPPSPILDYQWKRMRRNVGAKENCKLSLAEKLRRVSDDLPATARIRIENESSMCYVARDCSGKDADEILIPVNCSVLNGITNSPRLNSSRTFCDISKLDESKSPKKFHANSTLKRNDRRSLVRESPKIQESLSLSSPLANRNERSTNDNATNDSKTILKRSKKQRPSLSELLADESIYGIELTSSSPKIPETLTKSTIFSNHRERKNLSRSNKNIRKNFHKNKLETLHRRLVAGLSPIKSELENVTGPKSCSRVFEASNLSDRLSMPSPLRNNKLGRIKCHDESWIKLGNNLQESKVQSPRGSDRSNEIRESSKLPRDTSSSSRLNENLVNKNSYSSNRLISSPKKNLPRCCKSINTSWIKIEENIENFDTSASEQCINRLMEIRRSSRFSHGPSSSSQLVDNDAIDIESNTTQAPDDDAKIESDSDAPDVDLIDNVDTQNVTIFPSHKYFKPTKDVGSQDRASKSVEPLSQLCHDKYGDSDETYFSDAESIPRCRNSEIRLVKNSQKISQSTSLSHEERVSANRSEVVISQAASPVPNTNFESQAHAMFANTNNNDGNKKRRGKKGTVLAKLQSIVNSQVSNFRIWRYQTSRSDFDVSRTQFVVLKIRERETRFGRHYVTASVLEDSHDLLKTLFAPDDNLSRDKTKCLKKMNIVTLMMIPEVIGVVKIRADSTLKIYPPWVIMDHERKILNVTFFNVIATEAVPGESEIAKSRENVRIVEQFDCPCIRANALVESCPVKFSITKPSFMQEMFGS